MHLCTVKKLFCLSSYLESNIWSTLRAPGSDFAIGRQSHLRSYFWVSFTHQVSISFNWIHAVWVSRYCNRFQWIRNRRVARARASTLAPIIHAYNFTSCCTNLLPPFCRILGNNILARRRDAVVRDPIIPLRSRVFKMPRNIWSARDLGALRSQQHLKRPARTWKCRYGSVL